MSPEQLIPFFGLAAIYAGLSTATLFGVARLFGLKDGRTAPLVFLTLFFLFLTQHPFPDPATLACPVASAAPQTEPFWFVGEIAWRWDRGWSGLMRDRLAAASAMNFVLPALVGAALARVTGRWLVAAAFATAMTLFAEFSQLTGLWGVWPCAWRQFNVDDLILNSTGLVAGFALMRRVSRRAPPSSPSPPPRPRTSKSPSARRK